MTKTKIQTNLEFQDPFFREFFQRLEAERPKSTRRKRRSSKENEKPFIDLKSLDFDDEFRVSDLIVEYSKRARIRSEISKEEKARMISLARAVIFDWKNRIEKLQKQKKTYDDEIRMSLRQLLKWKDTPSFRFWYEIAKIRPSQIQIQANEMNRNDRQKKEIKKTKKI